MDESVASDDKPHAAAGERHVVIEVAVRVDAVLTEEGHSRRMRHPVAQLQIPDSQGAE